MSGKGPTTPMAEAMRAMMQEQVDLLRTYMAEHVELLRKELEDLRQLVQGNVTNTEGMQVALGVLDERMQQVEGSIEGGDDLLSTVAQQVERIGTKVDARNKSAPVKKHMTDDDARRVLDGDLADLQHKEAAERAGLTYAQVYSCRGEYTFKHVHKVLRDAGWKNPWAKDAVGHVHRS